MLSVTVVAPPSRISAGQVVQVWCLY